MRIIWYSEDQELHEWNLSIIHSFIPMACAECDDSLPFSGDSSSPLCYVIFLSTLLCQLTASVV